MIGSISKFCNNGKNTGLLLIDMPTGSGKTYSVLEFIVQNYNKPEFAKKKIFFITTLKKNLPTAELKEKFKDYGKEGDFDRVFLQIRSNEESILENLTENLEETIPDSITSLQEYKLLKNQCSLLKKLSGVGKEALSKDFRYSTEPKFRRKIQGMLKRTFPEKQARLRAVKSDNNWTWLGKLYPIVFTREKQIYFLSIDKFLVKNTPIIEPSYEFINSDLIENAIIFIDEFDATKDTILKHIINNGLNNRIDFLDLFKSIHSAFRINEFHKDLLTPSKTSFEYSTGQSSIGNRFAEIREKADFIFKKYKLQYSPRTEDAQQEQGKNFLFQDYRYFSILDDNKKFVTIEPDNKSNVNRIRFVDKKPSKKEKNIQPLLHDVKRFMSQFQRTIGQLSTNYRILKKERDNASEMTQEEAIHSVLDLFNLKEAHHDYLLTQIMNRSVSKSAKLDLVNVDNSVHTKGFRYYAFEDDSKHDMQSVVRLCEFSSTPEKYLLQCCKKAKVIGISATATLKSVLGNYDLRFLRSQLGNDMEYLPEMAKERIKNECKDNWEGYNKVNIQTELIDGKHDGKYDKIIWEEILSDSGLAEHAFNAIENSKCDLHDKERYARICIAYKNFLNHNDIQSFLCLLTKFPAAKDTQLNLDILEELFRYVASAVLPDFDITKTPKEWFKETVVIFCGADYDNQKAEITQKLAEGKRLFVISTYQTLGAGQNLQYAIPKDLRGKLIPVDRYRKDEEKDYDAIYMEKPTHLLVNLFNKLNEEDFVKSVFQTEFMQDCGELSRNDAKKNIKKAFRCLIGQKTTDENANLYDKNSVKLFATRIIIQAIGRICRTGWKNPNIYIYADQAIANCIDTSVKNGFYNIEFLKLLEKISTTPDVPSNDETLINIATTKSNKAIQNIKFMLDSEWTWQTMNLWKELRDFVIKFPTISKENAEINVLAQNYYVQLPKPGKSLYFKEYGDFDEIEISFVPKKGFKEASAEKSRIEQITKYPPLRDFFEKNQYPTEFKENDYLMSPPLWNNVYKGMLGEVAGSFLVRHLLEISLVEIDVPSIFEKFDFQTPGKPVFFDFKNWSESFDLNKKETRTKILKKAKECNARAAIVANILADAEYKIDCRDEDGVKILVIPSLLLVQGEDIIENIAAIQKIQEVINDCIV